jgi:hypothetical protein
MPFRKKIKPEELLAKYKMEYLPRVPKSVPEGKVLVHNQVYPVTRRAGVRGSRHWLEPLSDKLEICQCHWAPELGAHYRVVKAHAHWPAPDLSTG